MKNLIEEAPKVAEAFFDLTAAIRESSSLEPKIRELVLLGIFTASRSLKGIQTHVERALESGAKKDEIVSAIYSALPVCGVASVNTALDSALSTISELS